MRRGILAVLLGVACGGHEAVPVVVARPPPPAVQPAPEAEPAPQPLPRPYGVLHVERPKQLLSRLEGLLRPLYPNMPALDADLVAELLTGEQVGSIVDLDQPIDVLLFDETRRAGRIGMRAGAEPLLRERLNATYVKGEVLRFGSAERACEARGTEIACANSGEMLALALPYLRVSARESTGVDVHSQLVMPADAAATSTGDATVQMVSVFMGSISELTMDASARGANAELSAHARFSRADSPLARSLLVAPRNAPLDAFRRLPADARMAFLTTGLSSDVLAPFREGASKALVSSLMSDGYPEDFANEGVATFKEVFLTGGPFVLAGGFDQAALERAETAYRAAATDKTRAAVREALAGYLVAGVDEDPARWVKAIRHAVELDNRHVQLTKKPVAAAGAKDAPKDDDPWSCVTKLAPPPRGTPRDGLHAELVCHLKTHAKAVRTTHLLVVPEGQRTWLLLGEDLALLTAKAAGLLDARAATIVTRKDIQRCLARQTTLCGTFSALAGVTFFDDTTDAEIAASLARYDRMRAASADATSVVLAPAAGEQLELSAVSPLTSIVDLVSSLAE